jgi:hypothetical protein
MALYKPFVFSFLLAFVSCPLSAQSSVPHTPAVFGYRDFAAQANVEEKFLAVPDAKLAGQHLKTLTAEPHWPRPPKIARPPNTWRRNFARPAWKRRSFLTAFC